MKVALISDSHGMLPNYLKFEGVNFILHAGDVGPDRWKGSNVILPWYDDEFYPWAEAVGKPIYMTWGNHDFIGERLPLGRFAFPDNVHILVDEQVEIEGKKVWFSPWSNLFGGWAWMRTEEGLAERYAKIPQDTQVIVSHGPPYGLGDKIFWDGHEQQVGSKSLRDRLLELPNLELVVTGHIHEARGLSEFGKVQVRNVSLVDTQYRPVYDPIIVEW